MTDNYRLQASPVLADGTMLNIRAESGPEFASLLQWFEENAANVVSALQSVKAQANVATTLAGPGTQNVQQDQGPRAQQGSQQAPPAFAQPQQAAPQGGGFGGPPTKYDLSGPPGPAPQCQHGLMEWRHRTSKAGKEYKGWFCSSKNQNQQCEAQFIR